MFKKLIEHMERFKGMNKKDVQEDYEEMAKYMENHPEHMKELE